MEYVFFFFSPPRWLFQFGARLSVVAYWSSLELSVFILTSLCVNTPVTREQPPSDQITSSLKQTPLCGFGTRRSRPPAGSLSQCNSVTERESDWPDAKWKAFKNIQGEKKTCRLSWNRHFFLKSLTRRKKQLFPAVKIRVSDSRLAAQIGALPPWGHDSPAPDARLLKPACQHRYALFFQHAGAPP